MLTYQDFLASGDTEGFLKEAVTAYKNSERYKRANVAWQYYLRRNVEINRRAEKLLTTGVRSGVNRRVTKPVNKKCCGFFQKMVNQLAMYLLGNGVSLRRDVKDLLGKDFDSKLQQAGRFALIDGVSYGYWAYDRLAVFRATEFFCLQDEFSSENKAGIRFFRVGEGKPLYVELYEVDGVTTYVERDGRLCEYAPKKPYIYTVRGDKGEVISGRNYGVLPIVPFWGNDSRESELNDGLKNDIDLFDRVMSDFGDNLDRANDIYYIIKNLGGGSVKELIAEIEEYKAIYFDDEESGAEIHTVEVPYEARKTALTLLEKQMYKETQTLNTEELTGGSLTNVAIKVAMAELDLKADMLEWNADAFVCGILALAGVDPRVVDVTFKRRTLINDSETISNIYMMRSDIDHLTALELNPYISDGFVGEILERVRQERGDGDGGWV